MTAAPAATTNIMRMMVGSTIIATVRLNTTGKLAFLYSSGTTGGTSSNSFPTNQWFRVEMKAVASTTVGSVDVRCYFGADPDSTTITETLSVSSVNTGSNSAMDRLRAGIISSVTSTDVWEDDIAWSDVDWIGPAASSTAATPVPLVSSAAVVQASTW
ncbi:hypothetical protein [Frankia sp. Cj3]|uniref:hypothetical protein n=1 Tax=Frankia sp. Cj3 TaxID=2880976 RepID=UPI001EF6BCD7|nr:hypothetical protein [Frankia sp. Cj3]